MSEGERLYNSAMVPERHRGFRPKDNIIKKWGVVYDQLKNQIEKGTLSGIVGQRGTGKTQMGACLIGYCAYELQKPCLYRKSVDIFLRIREPKKIEGDSESKAIAEFVRPFLLVIDAFEVRSETSFENNMLNHILDKRYDCLKSTVILSNDSVESLQRALGESVIDRMRETGWIVSFDWQSLRVKKP